MLTIKKDNLELLGRDFFEIITNLQHVEKHELTEKQCIDSIKELLYKYNDVNYTPHVKTLYEQLQNQLGVKVVAAPDEWDRLYNVDFYIEINKKFIGLQIKPMNKNIQLAEIFKEKSIQEKSHIKFYKNFGGNVFYIYSIVENDKKIIQNPEVVEEIRNEIERLKQSDI